MSKFVDLAKMCGMRRDKGELEFFDKVNLLKPALRVFHPIAVFKKTIIEGEERFIPVDGDVSDEPYYHVWGIGRMTSVFRTRFLDKESVRYEVPKSDEYLEDEIPSEVPFEPWGKYADKTPGFTPNRDGLGRPAEHYYTEEQVLILNKLKTHTKINVSAQTCLAQTDWVRAGANLKKWHEENIRFLKEWSLKQNRLLGVYLGIRLLESEFVDELDRWADTQEKKYGEVGFEDIVAHWKVMNRDRLKDRVLPILQEHGVSAQQLAGWIDALAHEGINEDPNIHAYEWLKKGAPPYFWSSAKGPVFLAKKYYDVVERLTWAYNAIADRPLSIEGILNLRHFRYMPSCVICGKGFKPNSKRRGGVPQATCSKECSDRNKVLTTNKKRLKKLNS